MISTCKEEMKKYELTEDDVVFLVRQFCSYVSEFKLLLILGKTLLEAKKQSF